MAMYQIRLSDDEAAQASGLAADLAARHDSVEDRELVRNLAVYARDLPRELVRRLNEFRLCEPSGVCLLTGYRVDDEKIGPTPAGWHGQETPGRTLAEEIYFLLCGSVLGDSIAWATQQNRHLVHDVLPIRGHENVQINSASDATITWHTEDAFHPYRAEYIGLMCLRNDDGVESTYACIDDIELDDEVIKVLLQPRFLLMPDESHRIDGEPTGCDGRTAELIQRSRARIEQMSRCPDRVAVLFGDPSEPYIRIDPYFMRRDTDDRAAEEALDRIIAAIDDKLTATALAPGDVLFVDNFKAVHGRKSFKARYDGRDRWLKRLNIARDLRKSRETRANAESRVLF
jgi:Fe(II)/alpha-ketoglutarate-dependent arginine beta-hydroxylase